MRCRLTPLPCPALLFWGLVFLSTATGVDAHALNAELSPLPDGKVRVEGWFSTGQPAASAQVQVFRTDGQLFTEGQLDEEGAFTFTPEKYEVLRVVISTAGHRTERWLQGPIGGRESGLSIRDILAGVALVLAAAAFLLSLRNARRLRGLRQQI